MRTIDLPADCQIVVLKRVHQIVSDTMKGMTILLMNGLGVVKRSQDGEVNDRPRRRAGCPSRMSSMTVWSYPNLFGAPY